MRTTTCPSKSETMWNELRKDQPSAETEFNWRVKREPSYEDDILGQGQTKGPDEEKIKAVLDRTGYSLDITTGQRKYGGPPPNWELMPPGSGCEVFCGKIPKDMYEDELIPFFEKCGIIYDLRLMIDPITGHNRGYAFVTFSSRDGANEAVRQIDGVSLRSGTIPCKVSVCHPKTQLFVGNIPKSKDKDELLEEFKKRTYGLTDVIIYSSPDDRKKNRGFCFLEYESHKAASLAKRRLGMSRVKVWGCDIIVDWADPQEEPDDEIMSKVKVLYVRNLTQAVTEEKLKETFEPFGKVERVKKIKDYAFVHFEDREAAVKSMNNLNNTTVGGSCIEISLAKPPSDKKKKEEILRARERRMMQMNAHRPLYISPTPMGRGNIPGIPMGHGDFEHDDMDLFLGPGEYGDVRDVAGHPLMLDLDLFPGVSNDYEFDIPTPLGAQSVPFLSGCPQINSRFVGGGVSRSQHQPQTIGHGRVANRRGIVPDMGLLATEGMMGKVVHGRGPVTLPWQAGVLRTGQQLDRSQRFGGPGAPLRGRSSAPVVMAGCMQINSQLNKDLRFNNSRPRNMINRVSRP